MKIVITFFTTYYNLKAEEVLLKASVPIKVRPVPREISSDCGLAIEGRLEDKERIEDILKRSNVEFEAIHIIS